MALTTILPSFTRDAPLAAVTTIFTPSSFCGEYVDEDTWFRSKTELNLESCFPGEPLELGLADWYYSPAICPSGYGPACTVTPFDLDPPFLEGETAILCCPNSFHCAHYTDPICVSDKRTALSVHVRWQESDLSDFETPPLASDLPPSRRHAGWEPEGSLITVHTLPDDCSEAIFDWVFPKKESCLSPAQGFYSPGICPEGWTAAFTRPVLGDYGPPEEPDETAMFCCPSGMGKVSGVSCGPRYCASTTMITSSGTLSVSLLLFRDPIQIRWGSTDLSILETHPLTPGLVLNERTKTPPVTPGTESSEAASLLDGYTGILPELEATDSMAIGLAFIPVALAILVVTGLFFLRWKRCHKYSSVPMTPGPIPIERSYKPWILTWPPLLLLISISATSIVLLELSCNYLPTEAAVLRKREILPTKIYRRDVTIQKRQLANATFHEDSMECSLTSSISFAPVITENHGTTFTTESVYAASTACDIFGIPVELPTCQPPAFDAPDEAWLSGNSTSNPPPDYFVASMLSPLLAVLFAIPWKIIHLHAASLEPFYKLSTYPGTTLAKGVLQSYGGFGCVFGIVPLLTACLAYGSAILAPLAAEAWKIGLLGQCPEGEKNECLPQMQAVPSVIRTIEALLAILLLIASTLICVLRHWSTGVVADPRSIVGIASLAQSPDLRGAFQSVLKNGPNNLTVADMKSRIGALRVLFSRAPLTNIDYGITLLTRYNEGQENTGKKSNPRRLSFTMKSALALLMFTTFLISLAVLVIYYLSTGGDTGFEKFMSSQGFGPRFLFSACGVVISFFWAQVFTVTTCLAPYYSMLEIGKQPPRASVLCPYATDPYSHLVKSFVNRQFLLSLVSLIAIFSDFLPILLANVPFRQTRTLSAHLVSSWLTVAILSLMVIMLTGFLIIIYASRLRYSALLNTLKTAPMAGVLLVISQSEDFVRHCQGLSLLDDRERDAAVKEMGLRYHMEINKDQSACSIVARKI